MDAKQVKQIRRDAGLSTRQLARLMRITDDRTVLRWEAGERPVTGPATILLELIEAGELPDRFWPDD